MLLLCRPYCSQGQGLLCLKLPQKLQALSFGRDRYFPICFMLRLSPNLPHWVSESPKSCPVGYLHPKSCSPNPTLLGLNPPVSPDPLWSLHPKAHNAGGNSNTCIPLCPIGGQGEMLYGHATNQSLKSVHN